MTFVSTGLAIAGLAAAAVPIIIHLLLRRRRVPVEWAAFDLLREAMRRHRRRSRLERLLLLAVRTLLLAALGAALAQPLIGDRIVTIGPRTVHVILDDGIVSAITDEDGVTALERHVEAVRREVDALAPGDRVSVVLAGRPVRRLVDPPTTDHASAMRAIEGLPPREGGTDLARSLEVVADGLEASGTHEILVVSDFRSGSVDETTRSPSFRTGGVDASPPRIRIATPDQSPASSVRVENIEVAPAPRSLAGVEGSRLVRVDLRRSGETPAVGGTVRISGDAVVAEESRAIDWPAGVRELTVEFQVNADDDGGELIATVETMGGADDLGLDDTGRTIVAGRRPTRVLVLDRDDYGGSNRVDRWRGADWVAGALRPTDEGPLAESIVIDRVDPATVDARDLLDAGLVVVGRPDLIPEAFHQTLADWTGSGGVVVLLPPGAETVRPWATPILDAMSIDWSAALESVPVEPARRLAAEQPRSPITRLLEAELPGLAPVVSIERRLPVADVADADRVLVDDAGDPVLLQAPVGAGRLVFFTVAPELSWTDLPVRPLMVPLVQEIARQGEALAARDRDGVVGGTLPATSLADAVEITLPDGRRVPFDAGVVLERSGVIELHDLADRLIERRAVNADVEAALVEPTTTDLVRSWFEPAGTIDVIAGDAVESEAAGPSSNVASWLIAVVLGLALIETALARWFTRGGIVARRSAGMTGANADAEAASRARRGAAA